MAKVIAFPDKSDSVREILEDLLSQYKNIDSLIISVRGNDRDYQLLADTTDIEMLATTNSMINSELMLSYLIGSKDESEK